MDITRPPLYRITVELLEPPQPEWGHGLIGLYCFDLGKRLLEMTAINENARRFSFDLRSRGIGMYVCSQGMNFCYGPWYQAPQRKAVDGDI
jgi:hypothetical protein